MSTQHQLVLDKTDGRWKCRRCDYKLGDGRAEFLRRCPPPRKSKHAIKHEFLSGDSLPGLEEEE